MATLRTYRQKRDFGKTAEPRGKAGRKKGLSLRHPEARRDAAALRSAARTRRRDDELGGDARPEPRARRQAPRHPRRGPSDRIQQVRRHHPEGPIRRRHRDGLGPRHLDAGARSAQGHEEGPSRFRAARREAARPLASGAHAQAPGRAAGAVAADQGHRRIRAQEVRSGHPGRNAGLGRQRPHDGRDRRRQEAGLAFQQKRQGAIQGGQGRTAPKPSARAPQVPQSTARERRAARPRQNATARS